MMDHEFIGLYIMSLELSLKPVLISVDELNVSSNIDAEEEEKLSSNIEQELLFEKISSSNIVFSFCVAGKRLLPKLLRWRPGRLHAEYRLDPTDYAWG